MEIDATSSTSSDSHVGWTATSWVKSWRRKADATPKKTDYYKRDDYCAVANVVNSGGKGVVNKCDVNVKRTLAYSNSEPFGKKLDVAESRRVQLDYYNNNSNNVVKKSAETTIQLNSVDSYGKKSVNLFEWCNACVRLFNRGRHRTTDRLPLVPSVVGASSGQGILGAQAAIAFHRGSYHELYSILESHAFNTRWHPEFQTALVLWINIGCGRSIPSRRRSGRRETVYCFKERKQKPLKECYLRNRYPTPDGKGR
ncbi:hypothetical protein NQ318_022061 [Aromia moschata]|uniref:Homeobox protein SIX1 N-terminal SD domain-containing protein n=1 Tax=Aromia moschata TaxID=1265417 RepID=A0AAV8Z5B9_9CUCU|nr:hypothetical protein NQ318_022061 [Aromia moschata]